MKQLLIAAIALMTASANAEWTDNGYSRTDNGTQILTFGLSPRNDYTVSGSSITFHVSRTLETKLVEGSTVQNPPTWNANIALTPTPNTNVFTGHYNDIKYNVLYWNCTWEYHHFQLAQSFTNSATSETISRSGYELEDVLFRIVVVTQ
ncbi:MAG: hypothetical protein JNM28_03635 [Armatimonadetes bacterium]|nr:hypothetical protein [Armatimonadota bacterium]